METMESPLSTFNLRKNKLLLVQLLILIFLPFMICLSKVNAMEQMLSHFAEDDQSPRTITSVSFRTNEEKEVTLDMVTSTGAIKFFKGPSLRTPQPLDPPISLSVNTYLGVTVKGRGTYRARFNPVVGAARENSWNLEVDLTFSNQPGEGPVASFQPI